MINNKAYIILATYNPDLIFFRKQVLSISQQSYTNWHCVVSDDGSTPDTLKGIKEIIKDDTRFTFRQNERQLGVFHNFEAGLLVADQDAAFILYSDQDDVWKKNKIERCLSEFYKDETLMLVHSDMEMIDENDRVIHASCFDFENRDLSDFSLAQLVIKNTITGCTVCFRRSLLDLILPFPIMGRKPMYHHDLWTAMYASLAGKIGVIKEPLIEYRQHSSNVLGAVQLSWKEKLFKLKSIDEWRIRKKIIHDLLESIDKRSTPNQLRTPVTRWVRNRPFNFFMFMHVMKMMLTGKPDVIVGLKMMIGKTLDFAALIINRILFPFRKAAFIYRVFRELLKPDFRNQFKGAVGPLFKKNNNIYKGKKLNGAESGVEEIVENVFYLRIDETEAPAINIVLPNLNPKHIFGGVSTAIRMGISLVRLGHKIRFISSDLPFSNSGADAFKELLKKRFQVTEQEMTSIFLLNGFGRDTMEAKFSNLDIFVATFWPTAFKIENTIQKYSFLNKRFLYLIQDYEPGFYSWSDDYALVESTYRMNYVGIYNTSILADYFRHHNKSTINKDLVLQPEIEWARYSPPSAEDIQKRKKKRILIYGRPNTNRNLFRTVVTSLRFWIKQDSICDDQVEILSAGESHIPVELGNGIELKSVGKLTMGEYAKLLRESDLGISLMLSPHPSYPPFDMTASGMLVITNTYENKCIDLSPNFINTFANPRDIANSISENWHRLDNAEARIKGAVYSIQHLGYTMDHVTNSISNILQKEMGWDNSSKK